MLFKQSRARRIMADQKLDAVVATSPDNVTYASGCWVMSHWARPGGPQVYAVIPADGGASPCVVAGSGNLDLVVDGEAWVTEAYRYGFFATKTDGAGLSELDRRYAALLTAPDHGDAAAALVAALRDRTLDRALRTLFTERAASYAGTHVAFEGLELFPKPLQRPLPIYVGGHNEQAVARAARLGQGWLPGWRPFDEVRERTALLRRLTAEAGRDPGEVEAAVQLTVMLGRTPEEAAARYRRTGMVQHRRSLAHTGRHPDLAEANNLIGSPASVLDKLAFLATCGVDHVCALQFPHDSVTEMLEQMEWFARDVIGIFTGRKP